MSGFFQKGIAIEKVFTLNIVINGKGTVWVDDIVLTREPSVNKRECRPGATKCK